MTLPKFPLPSTAKKLKSSSPTFRFRVACRGGGCCGKRWAWDGNEPGRSVGRPWGVGGKLCFIWTGLVWPWGRGDYTNHGQRLQERDIYRLLTYSIPPRIANVASGN